MTFIRPTLVFLVGTALLTGLGYPLAMTGIGHVLMPRLATGSLVERDGTLIGSALVGQAFGEAGYLHPRPSAVDYNAAGAGASNLGPTSASLHAMAEQRRKAWEAENGTPAPIDAVTASGSGLDPDISVANARGQARRIAAARAADLSAVLKVLAGAESRPLFGIFGTRHVNVLAANLALDATMPMPPATRR